jgi:ribonucleoside-diphosphate reductase beta chain
MRSLGYFSTADSLVANNLVLGIYRWSPTRSVASICFVRPLKKPSTPTPTSTASSRLGMDEGEVFNMYREVPSVAKKAAWSISHTHELSDPNFNTGTPKQISSYCAT